MKFEQAVSKISSITDLRRVARAHVVDHKHLSNEQLAPALLKSKPQYVAEESIQKGIAELLQREPRASSRGLAYTFLVDVLLEQYDTQLPLEEADQRTIAFQQSIVDRSNELDLAALACGDKSSTRYRDLELYKFVLGVAWDHEVNVSPDEENLLEKLRHRLKINRTERRILEAQLQKYPKQNNETHNRNDLAEVRKRFQEVGILLPIRAEDGIDRDVISEETAEVLRAMFCVPLRAEAYLEMLDAKLLKRKSHLFEILEVNEVAHSKYDTVDKLKERIVANVHPHRAIAAASPRIFGLNSEELSEFCKDLSLSAAGSMPERVARIVAHYAQLRPRVSVAGDERELWFRHFEDLAFRDHEALRKQHIIDKDLEIERKFEDATRFLFDKMLGHVPLKQAGSNHCDGLLSLKTNYLMWDNKSRERAAAVSLRDHTGQFHAYMEASDKPVPIFMVIAPAFTEDSEVEATRYHAEHLDRNFVLITAKELKALAEEWARPDNKNREQPFPLGLLAASGRYDRKRLGKIY